MQLLEACEWDRCYFPHILQEALARRARMLSSSRHLFFLYSVSSHLVSHEVEADFLYVGWGLHILWNLCWENLQFQLNFRRAVIPKNLFSFSEGAVFSEEVTTFTNSFLIMLGTPLWARTLQDYQVLFFLGLISTVFEVLQGNQQGPLFWPKNGFLACLQGIPKVSLLFTNGESRLTNLLDFF